MTTERKKTGIQKFLSSYFLNLGKFTLVNLIFAVPLGLAFAICFVVCRFLLPQASMLILPLVIVLAAPFYSGVVVISKKIYFDELSVGLFAEFLRVVKENFKTYLIHGVVAYIAFVGCYHGIVIYKHLADSNPIFYVMFFVSIVLALFLLFMLYGVTLMSAFFDLKLNDVYKNSLLMTFGELKANFFATFGSVAYLAVLGLPVFIFGLLSLVWGETVSVIVIYTYIVLAFLLLVPSGVSSIIVASIYPNLKRVISGDEKTNIETISKEDNEEPQKPESPRFHDIDKEALMKSTGEYIFYNGKMIKKSVVLDELEEREENSNE